MIHLSKEQIIGLIVVVWIVLIIVFHIVKSKASKGLNSSEPSVVASSQKTYNIACWVLIILYVIGFIAFTAVIGPQNLALLVFSLGGGSPNF